MKLQDVFRKSFVPVLAFALSIPFVSIPDASAARVVIHAGPRPVRAAIVIGHPRPLRRVVYVSGVTAAAVDFRVRPNETRVYVNGVLRGTCDDFDGYPQKLYVRPGVHRLRLVTPDGTSIEQDVRLIAGTEIDIDLDLR